MITAMLSGNLGNHMFNYAIVRSVAKRTGFQYSYNPVPKYDYLNGKEQMDFLEIDYGPFPSNIVNTYTEKKTVHNNTDVRVYDADVFSINDNTDLVGGCWQSEQYYDKKDLAEWFKIKQSCVDLYETNIKDAGFALDENTCIINFRGGEYKGYSDLIIRPEYYQYAMNEMLKTNAGMKFIIITDDVACASQYIPGIKCFHISIGCDYYILNNCRYSILANSSFSIIPTWLNKNLKRVIAPKYWARHNVSNGYWAIGDQYYEGWEYIDRDGNIETYDVVKDQALKWRLDNGL